MNSFPRQMKQIALSLISELKSIDQLQVPAKSVIIKYCNAILMEDLKNTKLSDPKFMASKIEQNTDILSYLICADCFSRVIQSIPDDCLTQLVPILSKMQDYMTR